MTTAFVDTSAIYALLVQDDTKHQEARQIAERLEQERVDLVTSSFVVHEIITLLQARLGMEAVRELREAVLPLLEVVWIDSDIFERAVEALLAARARRVSLTDWSSFAVMRAQSIRQTFAFDEHFPEQGFELLHA